MVLSVRERLNQGVALHQAGRLDEAMAAYRAILAEAPDQPDTLHLLGVALSQTGRAGEGLPLLERAVAADPRIADFHADLAISYRALGRPRDAIRSLHSALLLEGGNPTLWYRLGDLHASLGNPVAAEECLTRAVHYAPDDAPLADKLAGQREAARQLLAEMTSTSPWAHGEIRYLPSDTVMGRSLELYGEFCPGAARLFEAILNTGEWVMVVGADVGALLGDISARVGVSGRVIAWEPQALLCRLARENIGNAELANVELRHAAAGDSTGWVTLPPIDYFAAGEFAAIAVADADQGGEIVRQEKIDDLGLNRLELLHIDAAGREPQVLDGARATIARCRPLVYVRAEERQTNASLILKLMEHGYRIWWHFARMADVVNFKGYPLDVFSGPRTYLFAVPTELAPSFGGLPEVTSPDDTRDAAFLRMTGI